MLRPTWYYFHDWKNGTISGVWAIGNAFIWWTSMPALAYVGFLAWRDRLKSLGLITLMGFGLWVMWGVQPRPLLYMHYMFECIPFACIGLAYLCYLLWHGESEETLATETGAATASAPLNSRMRQAIAMALVALIAAWFLFYYPLLSAQPIPWSFYNLHLWFGKAWI